MKIGIGNYRTRDGRKARVLCTDYPVKGWEVFGYVHAEGGIKPYHWDCEGNCLTGGSHPGDLTGEWREPVKYSVELWAQNIVAPNPSAAQIHNYIFGNYSGWDKRRTGNNQTKYRISVEEIPE